MTNLKKPALGRGLSALLSDNNTDVMNKTATNKVAGSVSHIPLNQIEANPFQPRTEFEPKALQELSESIIVHGIIQPITVRKIGFDRYQIISGERRVRASLAAGLKDIPAYIRVAKDQEMLEMAIIENIQRENLNPIEVALSYKRLIEECNLKQDELGERVGKDRSTVTNFLRLLKLPAEIQEGLKEGKISMGHARALLAVVDPNEQIKLYEDLVRENLSVRRIEDLVRDHNEIKKHIKTSTELSLPKPVEQQFENNQAELSAIFQSKILIKPKSAGKGEIVIKFNSESEYHRLLQMLIARQSE